MAKRLFALLVIFASFAASTLFSQTPRRLPLGPADIEAITTLVMLEDTRTFDQDKLAALLKSSHPEVRRRAALAVGRIGYPRTRATDAQNAVTTQARALLVTARGDESAAARRFSARGIPLWSLPAKSGRVRVPRLLSRLAREGVTSLLVEGGGETLWEFFRAGCVDRVAVFVAGRILGGSRAAAAVGGSGFALGAAARLKDLEVEPVGADFLVTGRL